MNGLEDSTSFEMTTPGPLLSNKPSQFAEPVRHYQIFADYGADLFGAVLTAS